MEKKTLGMMIAGLRKEAGLTQLGLAEQMGVTDKAVSKWERDLSCPDINSLPKLAEIFGVSVDELMQFRTRTMGSRDAGKEKARPIAALILKAVALAMGVATVVLGILGGLESGTGFSLLGLGLTCLALERLMDEGKGAQESTN